MKPMPQKFFGAKHCIVLSFSIGHTNKSDNISFFQARLLLFLFALLLHAQPHTSTLTRSQEPCDGLWHQHFESLCVRVWNVYICACPLCIRVSAVNACVSVASVHVYVCRFYQKTQRGSKWPFVCSLHFPHQFDFIVIALRFFVQFSSQILYQVRSICALFIRLFCIRLTYNFSVSNQLSCLLRSLTKL